MNTKAETNGLPRKGIVLLVSLSIFWGMAWPAIKISVSELQPWTFRTYCLVLSGIGILIFCHWAYFTVVRIFLASVAAISTLAIPVIGVFSSALILNEPVGSNEIIALGFVVIALSMVIFVDQRH